jgi:hypothetical protein
VPASPGGGPNLQQKTMTPEHLAAFAKGTGRTLQQAQQYATKQGYTIIGAPSAAIPSRNAADGLDDEDDDDLDDQ